MKQLMLGFLFITIAQLSFGQRTDPEFQRMLSTLLRHTVPTVTVNEYKQLSKSQSVVLLDAREKDEYDISHIEGAKYLGYNHCKMSVLKTIPKNQTIVIYCTVGYRSERIGEHLMKLGYKNVYNLHGSIFEWVNQGNTLVDKNGKTTKKVHVYRREWAKWLKRGELVYN